MSLSSVQYSRLWNHYWTKALCSPLRPPPPPHPLPLLLDVGDTGRESKKMRKWTHFVTVLSLCRIAQIREEETGEGVKNKNRSVNFLVSGRRWLVSKLLSWCLTSTETIIMYIYHTLINALSAHMIHINLNMIFYTHIEHSLPKQFTW